MQDTRGERRHSTFSSSQDAEVGVVAQCLSIQNSTHSWYTNNLADCMSWLPSLSEKCDNAERIHYVVLTEQQSILASQIAKALETDNNHNMCTTWELAL